MINSITLTNFKSILFWKVDFNKLTVLTGTNASGKSSIIQAIRMLSSSLDENNISGYPKVEGHVQPQFLKSKLSKDNFYCIEANCENGYFKISFEDVTTESCTFETPTPPNKDKLFPRILYLSASRLGPKNTLELSQNNEIGNNGEYVISFIDKNKYSVINEKLIYPSNLKNDADGSKTKDDFLSNIDAWLSCIVPGVKFTYDTEQKRNSSYPYYDGIMPTETGFGLSFTLPVIAALLYSWTKEETPVILIENPEAHLHPAAQSAMGKLLATAAATGKQVIVETHSDHIINGIRIASKQGNINYDDVQLHYFSRQDFNRETIIESPKLLADGKLDLWPKGFFDQNILDKAELLK